MKKTLALFSILASLLLLTACYAKKEEVDESIRTTKALFEKCLFNQSKLLLIGVTIMREAVQR